MSPYQQHKSYKGIYGNRHKIKDDDLSFKEVTSFVCKVRKVQGGKEILKLSIRGLVWIALTSYKSMKTWALHRPPSSAYGGAAVLTPTSRGQKHFDTWPKFGQVLQTQSNRLKRYFHMFSFRDSSRNSFIMQNWSKCIKQERKSKKSLWKEFSQIIKSG